MICLTCWEILVWSSVVHLVVPIRLHKLSETRANIQDLSTGGNMLPSFYIGEIIYQCDPEKTWRYTLDAVVYHPRRTYEEQNATFSLQCLPWLEQSYLDLPQRPAQKYYLFWGINIAKFYADWGPAMLARKDFIFVSLDRREGVSSNRAPPMPGITYPADSMNAKFSNPDVPPKFFLTFRGTMHESAHVNSTVRDDIRKSFQNYSKQGVVIEFQDCCKHDEHRYKELLDSAYVLVPAGHGRWSFRLSEVIESCAIPVIMADGLTLPYEDILDWSSISILLSERIISDKDREGLIRPQVSADEQYEQQFLAILRDPQKLLDQLPQDPNIIRATRQRVCEARKRYFGSRWNRFESLLKAAAVHVGLPGSDAYRHAKDFQMNTTALTVRTN